MDDRDEILGNAGTYEWEVIGQWKTIGPNGRSFFYTFLYKGRGPVVKGLELAGGTGLAGFKREQKNISVSIAHAGDGFIQCFNLCQEVGALKQELVDGLVTCR